MTKISDAELEVMNVIWKLKEATSLEIIQQLQHCNWNDNTIRTLINRLIIKKAVGISKKEGKIYTYVSLIDEKSYKLKRSKEFINQFYDGSMRDFLSEFVDCGELIRNDLEEMFKLIDDKD